MRSVGGLSADERVWTRNRRDSSWTINKATLAMADQRRRASETLVCRSRFRLFARGACCGKITMENAKAEKSSDANCGNCSIREYVCCDECLRKLCSWHPSIIRLHHSP